MLTLGVTGAFHEPAAVLVEDGHIVAALEGDEARQKGEGAAAVHEPGPAWPTASISWCLARRGIALSDVDHIAYGWDPLLVATAATLAETTKARAPDKESWWATLPLGAIDWVRHCVDARSAEARLSSGDTSSRPVWHAVAHQQAHAAATYLTSPFDNAAILCVNARGERASTTYGLGRGFAIETIGKVDAAHSLGLLFERVTRHLGFTPGSGEDKVSALAAGGKPRFRAAFRDIVIRTPNTAQYTVAAEELAERLGPPRTPGMPIEARHEDIACSLQECLNETVVGLADWLKHQTGARHLTAGGGVFRNALLNSALRDAGLFEELWISPIAGASGTAVGAALWVDHTLRRSATHATVEHTCWGPQFTAEEIEAVLARAHLAYGRPPAITVAVAARLASGKTVGWFQGAMEFGREALGSRLVLATPTLPTMAGALADVTGRDGFEPVACAVAATAVGDWFEDVRAAPFRSFVARVRTDKRPRIPAATHVDGTARVQTVGRAVQPLFHDVIDAFGALTGVPILLSADFATHGRMRVCSPADAIEAYASSPLDALALGPFLLQKDR